MVAVGLGIESRAWNMLSTFANTERHPDPSFKLCMSVFSAISCFLIFENIYTGVP
jgi:hypothetical protein